MPQEIYNRDKLVGALVGAADYTDFLRWQTTQYSLADAAKKLREVANDENYLLPETSRADRANPFYEQFALCFSLIPMYFLNSCDRGPMPAC